MREISEMLANIREAVNGGEDHLNGFLEVVDTAEMMAALKHLLNPPPAYAVVQNNDGEAELTVFGPGFREDALNCVKSNQGDSFSGDIVLKEIELRPGEKWATLRPVASCVDGHFEEK